MRKQAALMVAQVTRDKLLPAEGVDQIVAKTDGVPLFLEELTKAVLESGLLTEGEKQYRLNGTLSDLTIPSTLQDSLMARLDRLAPVKEVAQIGACIGRNFSFSLVAAVSPLDDMQVAQALDKLTDSGLVHRSGHPSDATYTFKHALVQDVAYQSILKAARARLHEQIVNVTLARYPELANTEPEVIAHHYTQAGLIDKALPFWSSAGQKALARTALPESVGHLSKALELVQLLPPSPARDRSELDIRIQLAIAQMAFGGWAHGDIPRTLEPASGLAAKLADKNSQTIALFYLWLYHLCVPVIDRAFEYAEELRALREKQPDRESELVSLTAQAMTHAIAGHFLEAKSSGDALLALYDFELDSPLTHKFNHDLKCMVLGWAAHYCWALGLPDQARAASQHAIQNARRIDHSFNLLWARTGCTVGYFATGASDLALRCNREARESAKEHAMAFAEGGPCNYFGGPALIAQGKYPEGFEMASVAVSGHSILERGGRSNDGSDG